MHSTAGASTHIKSHAGGGDVDDAPLATPNVTPTPPPSPHPSAWLLLLRWSLPCNPAQSLTPQTPKPPATPHLCGLCRDALLLQPVALLVNPAGGRGWVGGEGVGGVGRGCKRRPPSQAGEGAGRAKCSVRIAQHVDGPLGVGLRLGCRPQAGRNSCFGLQVAGSLGFLSCTPRLGTRQRW